MSEKAAMLKELKKKADLLYELGFKFSNQVSDEALRDLESLHKIDTSEDILALMNRRLKDGFWDIFFPDETSAIITTNRLSVERKNEVIYAAPWSYIESVEYKNAKFIFFYDNQSSDFDEIKVEYFKESDDLEVSSESLKAFAGLLSAIASMFENEELRLFEKIQKYYSRIDESYSKHSSEDFLELVDKYFAEYGGEGSYSDALRLARAEVFYHQRLYENAMQDLEEYFKSVETPHPNAFLWKGLILKEKAEYYAALQNLNQALCHTEDYNHKEIIKQEFADTYKLYIERFTELIHEKRKAIVVTDKLEHLAEQILVLDSRHLPQISFSGGLCKNEIYVAHPKFSNLYIPFRNYEHELFYDKINEYLYLLQCLGAKEIRIQVIKGEEVEEFKKKRLNLSAEAGVKIHNVKASSENTNETLRSGASGIKIEKIQKFSPTKKPYLPDGLIWYENEPSWQRLYQQRLNGNILETYERISTSKTKVFSQQELRKIESDYRNFLISIGLKFGDEMKMIFKEKEEIEWEVSVVFAPISELHEIYQPPVEIKDTTANISTTTLSAQELEYLEMYEDAFEDFTVTDDEMRMLERRRQKLGISEERAKELAEMVKAKRSFTKEELEYMEECRYCLENDAEISPDERRLLDKLGKKLNLTSERMTQLESLVKQQLKG